VVLEGVVAAIRQKAQVLFAGEFVKGRLETAHCVLALFPPVKDVVQNSQLGLLCKLHVEASN
jgi:hypothetical protein